MEKTHWKKKFNYDYLGSYSFKEGEETKILTIKTIAKEDVVGNGGKKENLLVARFAEPEKPMILNRTNCKAIEKAYGTAFIEDWIGKQVTIFVQTGIKVGAEVTDGLRIRPVAPYDEIKIEDLQSLFDIKKESLTEAESTSVETVIKNKDNTKYKRCMDFLKSK